MAPRTLPFVLALTTSAGGALAAAPAASSQPAPEPTARLAVPLPAGDCDPVLTDGLFSPGEWDDARRVEIAEGVTVYLKEHRGVVFIGVRGEVQAGIGPSEVFLASPGGPIYRLHVSAQLAEAVLPAEGDEPPTRFGLTTDWYASELRRDEQLAERLRSEGRSPIDVIVASSYPSDGIEVAVRRTKLPGRLWLLRLSVSGFLGGKPGRAIYPPGTAERITDGWLELSLQ